MQHVDDVVRQPKEAEGQHDGQDELLTPNVTAELGLSDPPQDAYVAAYNDPIGNYKPQHELQCVLEDHLCRGDKRGIERK